MSTGFAGAVRRIECAQNLRNWLFVQSRVVSFTPLRVRWPHSLGTLARQVSVVERPIFDENDWKKGFNLRTSEEKAILEASHWLCIESECEPHEKRERLAQSAVDLRSAMLAFQIWAPKGWVGVIVNTEYTDKCLLRVVSVSIAEPYAVSRWANLLDIMNLSVDELGKLIDGTLFALEAESIQSRNPFQYLEIGLQTAVNHLKAGALLWMIGLDALLAAQKAELFASRLCHLLGKGVRVFPDDRIGRRPSYTVGDVASDIYQMRNQIAHGDRIREQYLARDEFRFEPPVLEYLRIRECTYQSLLFEAALFTLTAALRKVILDGHLELLKDPKAWKKYLDGKADKASLPNSTSATAKR